MKLSRKQKTIRNFLLAALLLFSWWVLTGMHAFTAGQALKWETQQRGIKETPQILYRSAKDNYTRRVLSLPTARWALPKRSRHSCRPQPGFIRSHPRSAR